MKKQVILMSLAIAGLLCCIPMFVLNAPGAPGLSGGAASLLGMAGAVLFGAAYLYFFGVPKWVNITLLGLACVKLLLDWMFTVWYRRQY